PSRRRSRVLAARAAPVAGTGRRRAPRAHAGARAPAPRSRSARAPAKAPPRARRSRAAPTSVAVEAIPSSGAAHCQTPTQKRGPPRRAPGRPSLARQGRHPGRCARDGGPPESLGAHRFGLGLRQRLLKGPSDDLVLLEQAAEVAAVDTGGTRGAGDVVPALL